MGITPSDLQYFAPEILLALVAIVIFLLPRRNISGQHSEKKKNRRDNRKNIQNRSSKKQLKNSE